VRVVHYLWSAQIGGIERLVLDLAVAQRAAGGIDASVLLGAERGQLLDRYRNAPLPLEVGGLRGGADISPAKFRRLARLFAGAEVVHMHAYHPLVARAAASSRARIVFTEHGAFGVGRKTTLADRAKRFLKRRFVNRRAHFVTFNSEYTRRTARSMFGLDGVPQEVVYNGTPVRGGAEGPPDAALAGRCRGRFVVGAVSRFTARKRLDRLLQGFARMEGREDALLLLVGDGPERAPLEAQAKELGIRGVTVFTGYRADAAALERLMDVCVVPSEAEPFGLAAVEALALGKPAVVFRDGGGLVEVVSPCEPRDVVAGVEELAVRLAQCREEGQAGEEARRAYARRFDIRIMAERMRGIYGRLAHGRP
jgi:glycosyltransferase involved in cell wall biosynthesis